MINDKKKKEEKRRKVAGVAGFSPKSPNERKSSGKKVGENPALPATFRISMGFQFFSVVQCIINTLQLIT